MLAAFGADGLPFVPLKGGQGTSWLSGDLVLKPSESSAAARRHAPSGHRPSQLIHGDLGGNVLFHDQLPPAIIDFSAYWRPVGFASAIVVADALVWQDANARLLASVSHIDDFGQYLIRALIYRAVTDCLLGREDPVTTGGDDDRWAPAVDLACQLAAGCS